VLSRTQVAIPTFVRIKPGALDRLGIYAARHGHRRLALVVSRGMVPELLERAARGLAAHGAAAVEPIEADAAASRGSPRCWPRCRPIAQAVVGLGGGKALDVAKYLAHLAQRPCYAVPTSLSNDGFCSPQASLTLGGRRRSLAATLPFAVVVDTEVCLRAPEALWWSGVGDLVSKVTAVADWKLAYHRRGEPVDDLAALLSDASVFQFLAAPGGIRTACGCWPRR
jgi:glycerol-1-phosphate dehydrogenase [NAD(P)+]